MDLNLGSPLDDGADQAAGPAPIGDEIYQDGEVRPQHLRRELALTDRLHGAAAHPQPPGRRRRAAEGTGRASPPESPRRRGAAEVETMGGGRGRERSSGSGGGGGGGEAEG